MVQLFHHFWVLKASYRWFQQGCPQPGSLLQARMDELQMKPPCNLSSILNNIRLLILDNDESHTTAEFRDFCKEHNIILLWMPPNTSHLLQPMDVGCFGPLKAMYRKQNQFLIRNHIFHIMKEDFLDSFHNGRPTKSIGRKRMRRLRRPRVTTPLWNGKTTSG